ncbi:MAG TPA: DUF2764 family protein [Lentimicrobium sp.]|nr:DUF2764 family protein [Lentimicrobium sp.]
MRNYYYLVAGLPDLTIDQGKLQFGSVEFREYLKSELSEKDYELIEWLFFPADNYNLINLLTRNGKAWNDAAVYSREELELAIAEIVAPDKILADKPSEVKPYFREFILSFYSEAREHIPLTPENELATLYYNDALKVKNKFLKEWFEFEINLKNMLVYNIAQKFNLSFDNELIGNTFLTNALKNKVGRDMGEVAEWPYFEKVNQITENNSNTTGNQPDIAARERALDYLRWSVLDEMNLFNYFSIEVIISYMIKLMMIERWLKLDPKTGEELFRRLIGDLQSGYEFPNEFSINDGKK